MKSLFGRLRFVSSLFSRIIACLASTSLVGVIAHAQIAPGEASTFSLELRSPIGVQGANANQLNEGIADRLQVKEVLTFGGDFLAGYQEWYAGIRYDSLSSYKLDGKNLYELAAHLFSAIVQKKYRFESRYLAPTLTVGVFTPSEMNARLNGVDTPQYKANKVRSASLGLEGGWILDVYLLGAEVGYQYLTLEDFSGSDGSRFLTPSGAERKGDLSGPYAKFILGLHFW